MNVRGMSSSREGILPSFSSVEPGVVKAPDFAGGLTGCAELSVPLKDPVDWEFHLNCDSSQLWFITEWWCGISSW